MKQIELIEGGLFTDDRGRVCFVNDFDFSDVRRFYIIENSSTDIVRAWIGHKIENKYFFVATGKFLIGAVEIDDWEEPSKDLETHEHILTEKESKILKIPAGFANGVKALEPNSKLIVFSSLSLEEGKQDDYRFPAELWLNWKDYTEEHSGKE